MSLQLSKSLSQSGFLFVVGSLSLQPLPPFPSRLSNTLSLFMTGNSREEIHKRKRIILLDILIHKIFKRVKKAWKHGKEELGGLCDEEFVDIGTSERTIKEKLKCTLFSDYEGIHLYM
ncbi:uncharacterized protein LOC109949940 [Prunus persica]|uniref:uncharacterized protein LOC109948264 n=1 Tax=Prunus persica TaxID=3760 RepID=UPI0009AB87F5|nr:uncharacterized protein LOC109948264 [Prunus persica]XP_020422523.1 uncharacterized protein LOC109949940 [Prunus persica]